MTASDLAILLNETIRNEIERAITLDPARVALSVPVHGALIATQIKYLQRARTKLPSYYAARCILPPLAFEQSSSEETASLKDFRGRLCIDLTCGLGVDSLYLSRGFDRVIALERDETVAETARMNFARLDRENIDVLTCAAEEFLNNPEPYLNGERPELIYVDPARRGSRGEKLFRLEECSPDVVALMPRLCTLARRVVVKASPLFDVEEAFRLFGEAITVEVVSLHDECKEVLIILDNDPARGTQPGLIRATRAGKESLDFAREVSPHSHKPQYRLRTGSDSHFASDKNDPGTPGAGKYSWQSGDETAPLRAGTEPDDPATPTESVGSGGDTACQPPENQPNTPGGISYKYLLIPDVSLYKARLVEAYARTLGIRAASPTGYCFADELPAGFFGRAYPIREVLAYQPKKLKSRFKSEGITRCNFLKKDFPLNAAQIAAALGVREGGTRYAAFTCLGDERYALLLDHD